MAKPKKPKYEKPTVKTIKASLGGLGGKVNVYSPWNKTKGQEAYLVVWKKT